jgi:hypothetical protein
MLGHFTTGRRGQDRSVYRVKQRGLSVYVVEYNATNKGGLHSPKKFDVMNGDDNNFSKVWKKNVCDVMRNSEEHGKEGM